MSILSTSYNSSSKSSWNSKAPVLKTLLLFAYLISSNESGMVVGES
nr:MAG TPA: hypothetical protein [Caudoviricetes sp.]